ncbi:hypothetical protein GCM10027347_03980 [Larkinella harenae]
MAGCEGADEEKVDYVFHGFTEGNKQAGEFSSETTNLPNKYGIYQSFGWVKNGN